MAEKQSLPLSDNTAFFIVRSTEPTTSINEWSKAAEKE